MADPTRECSFDIQFASQEEVAWFTDTFTLCDRSEEPKSQTSLKALGINHVELLECGFNWVFFLNGLEATIYADDYPNIEAMASLLVAYLSHFNKDEVIGFTYSDGCTKPRPGTFGGGVVVCAKEGASFNHTDRVVTEMINAALLRRGQ